MARIPIRDIPNAPQPRIMMPQSSPSVSAGAVASTYDRLGRSMGNERELNPGMFREETRGQQMLVGAIGDAGQLIGQIANKAAEARTSYQAIEAATELRSEWASFQASLSPASDPAGWAEAWDKRLKEYQSRITSKKELSEPARMRINEEVMRFGGQTMNQLTVQSQQAIFERSKNAHMSEYKWAIETGDIDFAEKKAGQMVQEGLLFEEEGEALGKYAKRQGQWNAALGIVETSPLTAPDALDKLEHLTTEQRERLKGQAESNVNRQRADRLQGIKTKIEAGELLDPEQIGVFGGGFLKEADERALRTAMKQRDREMKGPDGEEYLDLWREIESYDFQADAKHEKYFELKQRLLAMPSQWSGKLSQKLYARYDNASETKEPKAYVRSSMLEYVKKAGELQMLAGWEVDKEGKPASKEDDVRKFQTITKLTDSVVEWTEANPGATAEDGVKWLQQHMTQGGLMRSEPADKKGFFGRLFGRDEKKTPNQLRDEILGMPGIPSAVPSPVPSPAATPSRTPKPDLSMNESADFRGMKAPASIRFNNPGAQYPGESARKFGSTETKIIGGGHKIAVFPDAISGAAAQFDLLDRRYAGMTLKAAITKWSGGNSVSTYLKVIERDTGLKADDVLSKDVLRNPETAVAFVKAMARQEAGKPYPLTDEQWRAAHAKAFS